MMIGFSLRDKRLEKLDFWTLLSVNLVDDDDWFFHSETKDPECWTF